MVLKTHQSSHNQPVVRAISRSHVVSGPKSQDYKNRGEDEQDSRRADLCWPRVLAGVGGGRHRDKVLCPHLVSLRAVDLRIGVVEGEIMRIIDW